jgi:hypothetical protein
MVHRGQNGPGCVNLAAQNPLSGLISSSRLLVGPEGLSK